MVNRVLYSIGCYFLLILGALFAEEFTTLDGKHYADAALKRVDPDGLVIYYPDGVAKLKFKNLTPELQEKYKYNPDAEKEFLEKSHAEDVRRSQENHHPTSHTPDSLPPASHSPDSSFVATTLRNQLLDEKIKVATYNCEFIKKRIASLENEISSEYTQGGLVYLNEALEKKKSELPIKEAILAALLAERNPTPTPTPTLPPPNFLEKYGQYLLWSLLGIAGIILFLWRRN
jgi:hypothetical protein